MEDILYLDLGSTREDPGTSRPLVSRGVRSDGADACVKGSDAPESYGKLTAAATKNRSENLEDILCLDLGSTREDPGTSRPLVSCGVRSDGCICIAFVRLMLFDLQLSAQPVLAWMGVSL